MEFLIGNVSVILDMETRSGSGVENYVFPARETNPHIRPDFLDRLKVAISEARKSGFHKDLLGLSVIFDDHGFLIRW